MKFRTERELEDWLYDRPEIMKMSMWYFRQLELPSGRLDLLGLSEIDGAFVVVELKNREPRSEDLAQINRYRADLERIIPANEQIRMILLFPENYDIANKLVHEANALNVELISFDVEPRMTISGRYKFSESYQEEIDKKIDELKASEDFIFLWDGYREMLSNSKKLRNMAKYN